MEDLLLALALILGFFLVLLLVQFISKKRFCALCGAVFFTWILLLGIYYVGMFKDVIIIALLIGQSTLGIFYFFEKKVAEPLTLFRLPFLVTLLIAAYTMLIRSFPANELLLFGGGLWLLFGGLYFYRQVPALRQLAQKVIACCKNW